MKEGNIMENTTGYSLADIAAATGNEGTFGGSGFWLIILFLFFMNGGWGGNRGELNQYATAASQQQILFNQQFDNLSRQINAVGDGISSLGYNQLQQMSANTSAINGNITTEGRNIQSQLANCCCENRLATANLGAHLDQQTAAIQQAIHAEGEATRTMIQQNELQTLRDKVASLEMDNRMCGVVRYPQSFAYSAQNPFCNCGN